MLASHVSGPGFYPQHHKHKRNKTKEKSNLLKTGSVSKDVKNLGNFDPVRGNMKYCSSYEKQYGDSSNN